MRAVFHPEADDDFIRGLQHYAGKQPELGQRFYHHINQLVAEIEQDPSLFRIYRTRTRGVTFGTPSPKRSITCSNPTTSGCSR